MAVTPPRSLLPGPQSLILSLHFWHFRRDADKQISGRAGDPLSDLLPPLLRGPSAPYAYWAVDLLPFGDPIIGVPSGNGRAAIRNCSPCANSRIAGNPANEFS